MKTIADYQKNLKTRSKTLIPSDFNTRDYLADYFADNMPAKYDLDYMGVRYADLALVTDDITTLETLVITCIETHAYKWEKLYNLTQLEYNPIWNVDGTETTTTDRGVKHTTNKYGDNSSTSENSEKPYDSDTYKDTGKNVISRDEYEDEITEDANQDVVTVVRGGNIGVTKTQELIQSEREVVNFKYLDVVMKDIIDAISYPFYI